MPRKRIRDVVVLLPGIMGSVLAKDGKEVWAPTGGALLQGLLTLGESVHELALTSDSPDADDLGDGVVATRLVSDVHLIPGLWKIDGYSKLSHWLQSTFDLRPGENFFEFPYDWRRDNRAAAHRFARQSAGWLRAWRERSSDDAKLVLVGHSMGGLISRYFLECLEGWKDTRLLITFGTPYRGSVKALGALANGMAKAIGPLSLDLSEFVRSLTSVYQLLPIYPCVDAGTGDLSRVTEVEIAHVDRTKAEAARVFHDQIREAVTSHLRDDTYLRDRYRLRPVIGTSNPRSSRPAGRRTKLSRSARTRVRIRTETEPCRASRRRQSSSSTRRERCMRGSAMLPSRTTTPFCSTCRVS